MVNGFKVLNEPQGEPQLQGLDRLRRPKMEERRAALVDRRPARGQAGAGPCRWPRAARYEVSVGLTKARDYGIVQLSLDGKKAGEPIDLYNPDVVPSGPIALGVYDLAQGRHDLTVEIVGANPKAEKSYMFGISELELKPAR